MGPKKQLGQHFLIAPSYAKRIAEAVPCCNSECKVLEIGPGRGALSVPLKERCPAFHLVEVDKDVLESLTRKLGEGEYTLHRADVMKFDYGLVGFPLHVVGNLPYNIGACIIKKTLLYGSKVKTCTFMVQREVAQRIVSGPHSRDNGFLSIFCQFFGTVKILFNVPPGAFFPPPRVDSSVFQVVVDPNVEEKLSPEHWERFFAFVDSGFSMRRKQLAKILSVKYGKRRLYYESVLEQIGIDKLSRPEDLDVSLWLELFRKCTL
ncbi:16S rRNA (adenine(1518)-N(6)/adenine(1519)-N(6))-dimethyltransferase RsmA [Chitinispirillales bacterium ANBcel5]|uniref:16S rRNA (adenine(1518)-N(6)/adenine(1519)-N(6))- dimethyltransferase RsmA n=1 Tax=Cellulosispirillum alkaliphilum TaxID=3039283 RepID=UPI002A59044C|nr:16S rRNA (adenine(1518)-N(6)/adenine(1519)-N(6))-dimethyltransferase RsmA [Chitinispirillales bacterium ANBcel5]